MKGTLARLPYIVEITKGAQKQARKAPPQVRRKLAAWRLSVEEKGLPAVRKVPGWHDEPLVGRRDGQRSIRLSRLWRAIYVEYDGGTILVEVQEVTPHDY